jgi:hypothetical protein
VALDGLADHVLDGVEEHLLCALFGADPQLQKGETGSMLLLLIAAMLKMFVCKNADFLEN